MTAMSGSELRFTTVETEEVERITSIFTKRAKFDLSVERLISLWKSFSRDVEEGYAFGLDEYLNDLSVRSLLQELIDGVSIEASRKIKARIAASDDRFEVSTQEIARSLSPSRTGEWWRRVPRKLAGDLQEDLRRIVESQA
jgi:hypothetical protein